jgi:hypothetical protein
MNNYFDFMWILLLICAMGIVSIVIGYVYLNFNRFIKDNFKLSIDVSKNEESTNLVKFKDVPVGGRIKEYGKTWVVLETYGRGLIVEYTGEKSNFVHLSRCCFTDPDEGITLDTEVLFIN